MHGNTKIKFDHRTNYLVSIDHGPNNSCEVSSWSNRFYETGGHYCVPSISQYSEPLQSSPKSSGPILLRSTSIVFSQLCLNLQNKHFVSKLLTNLLTYIYVYLKLYIYIYVFSPTVHISVITAKRKDIPRKIFCQNNNPNWCWSSGIGITFEFSLIVFNVMTVTKRLYRFQNLGVITRHVHIL